MAADRLRKWVDDPASKPKDLEKILRADEDSWRKESRDFMIYNFSKKPSSIDIPMLHCIPSCCF